MNPEKRNSLHLCWLVVVLLLASCGTGMFSSPTPTKSQLTVTQIKNNPDAYEGQLIDLQGFGVLMMTVPLCPGYVGMDTRLVFVDEQNDSIVAVVTASAPGAERGGCAACVPGVRAPLQRADRLSRQCANPDFSLF